GGQPDAGDPQPAAADGALLHHRVSGLGEDDTSRSGPETVAERAALVPGSCRMSRPRPEVVPERNRVWLALMRRRRSTVRRFLTAPSLERDRPVTVRGERWA